jgi:hypothetical protein
MLEKMKPILERRVMALELAYEVFLNFLEAKTTYTSCPYVS